MAEALVVGFDGMDHDVARELMARGRMPNLARLCAEGLTARMGNPIGMLTGPVWPTLVTGTHPSRHGRVNWRVLRAGTYRLRWLGEYSRPDTPPFWEALAASGRTCTIVDVPTLAVSHQPGITQLAGWNVHVRQGPLRGTPTDLVDAVRERFAPTTHDTCDAMGAAGQHAELHAAITRELASYVDGLDWLVRERPADVVVAVLASGHCAGHHFWHLHDPESHDHDAELAAELGDVIAEVYASLDEALGRLLDAVAPSLTLVVLSHGMGENVVMPHLIDPIAWAIDKALGGPPRLHWVREVLRRTPNRVSRLVRRTLRLPYEHLDHIADGSRRWFPIENFPTHGALRLNVEGREPNGRITRADLAATIDRLEAELLALRNADTGEPVVERVIRMADHDADVDGSPLPDVLVEWRRVGGIVEGVTSPTIGTIRRPYPEIRTGAHRPDGLMVLRAPGVPAGATTELESVDVWPTLAALLGVDPGDVDGAPLALAVEPSRV